MLLDHAVPLGDVVELPLTMSRTHTMFEILREPGIDRWIEKAEWIARHHGFAEPERASGLRRRAALPRPL